MKKLNKTLAAFNSLMDGDIKPEDMPEDAVLEIRRLISSQDNLIEVFKNCEKALLDSSKYIGRGYLGNERELVDRIWEVRHVMHKVAQDIGG